jgi:2-oxo-4-hydroxy-4-carboxy-5-ureidoimidazoline decarboxylase
MTLDDLNLLARAQAALTLSRCCGSAQWAKTMALKRPYFDQDELLKAADSVWQRLSSDDWREAFSCHPKIGDLNALREQFASTTSWAEGEQACAGNASEETLESLAKGNAEYEKKFGYIFIVCATGKTAEEMVTLLRQRLSNDSASELRIAAEEQRKITRLRLQKLLDLQP